MKYIQKSIVFSADTKYYQEYKNGLIHGKSIKYHENGKPHKVGQFVNGNDEGLFKYYNEAGDLYCEGLYKNGREYDGEFGSNYKSFDKSVYKNGKFIELYIYHSNGKLSEHIFKDSLRIYYNKQGNEIARATEYDNDPYNGTAVNFWPNGNISKKVFCKQGKPFKVLIFRKDATLKTESIYENDKKIKETLYYPSGEIFSITEMPEDNFEKCACYDKQGNKIGSCEKKNNIKNGDDYNCLEGVIYSLTTYRNDTAIYKNKFSAGGNLLFEIDYNGNAKFCNKWGDLIGQATYQNGKPYNGTFCNYDYRNHIYSINNLKEGLRNGLSQGFDGNSKQELFYSNGKAEGILKNYWNNKLLCALPFKNDVTEGEAVFYDSQGIELSRGIYKNDKKFEGTFYTYSDSKITRKESYLNGKAHGDCYMYDSTGKLESIYSYSNDTVAAKKHYLNGKEYPITYKNNKKWQGIYVQGTELSYYEEGKKIKYERYKTINFIQLEYAELYDDSGTQQIDYYATGVIKSNVNYHGYKKNGEAIYYSEDGKVESKGIFKMNVPVSGKFTFKNRYKPTENVVIHIIDRQITATSNVNGIDETQYQLKKITTITDEAWHKEVEGFLKSLERSLLGNRYDIL